MQAARTPRRSGPSSGLRCGRGSTGPATWSCWMFWTIASLSSGPMANLVRSVGRKGEGPGEFQQIKALAVWRDGRIAVPDQDHAAIQVFNPEGELERFVRMDEEDKPLSMLPWSRTDPGRSVRREARRSRRRRRAGRHGEPHESAYRDTRKTRPRRASMTAPSRHWTSPATWWYQGPSCRDGGLLGRNSCCHPPTKKTGGRWSRRWKTGTSSRGFTGMCCPMAPSPTPTPRRTPSSLPLPMDR